MQFAQVFPTFMENCFKSSGDEDEERKVAVNPQHKLLIDQYKAFFEPD